MSFPDIEYDTSDAFLANEIKELVDTEDCSFLLFLIIPSKQPRPFHRCST